MPQTQIAKKHHYIPEFYLKRWAGKGRLVEFRKHFGGVIKAKAKYPGETGYTRLGYALRGFPPDAASALEELYFKPVDTRAADTLAKMETGTNHLTHADRVAWAQFVLSLVHRQPERIEHMRRMFESLTLRITKADQRRWRRERRPTDPGLLADAIRTEWARNADQLHRRGLQLMTNAISSDLLNRHLVQMQWGTITLPPDAVGLLTSDRPVQWYNPMSSDQCHILVPVAPKRVFWAVNTLEMAWTLQARTSAYLTNFLNEQAVRRAVECAYGISEGCLAYVAERFGVDPIPNHSDAAYEDPTPKRLKILRRQATREQKTGQTGSAPPKS